MSEEFYVECDGPITIQTFTTSSEAAIDTWFIAFQNTVDSTPPDQPFLILMDVSSKNVSFTRYARQKTLELFARYKQRRGRLAFLFSSKTAPYFARIFFASLEKLSFEQAYFSNRAQAISWLREGQTEG
jgi:hypothetical protein